VNWGRAAWQVAAVAAIGTVAALSISHLRPDARSEARDGSIPLVKAEPGPVKVKPRDPGGLNVPHKDKSIYERLEGNRKVAPAGDPKSPPKAAKPGQKNLAQAIGPYRVQLGSFGTTEGAQRRWQELRGRHADVIGRLQMVVERVEVRGKGTVYRLQAGPLQSPGDVQKLCAALHKRKVGCFAVKS
jgi:hypothetical protein